MTKNAPQRSVFCVLMYYFRRPTAFIVIGVLEILGPIPVDVDPAVPLVGIEGTAAGIRGIISIQIHRR